MSTTNLRSFGAMLRSNGTALMANCDGAALVEYAVVLATLSVLMIGVLGLIAGATGRNLNTTQTGMTSWSQTQ